MNKMIFQASNSGRVHWFFCPIALVFLCCLTSFVYAIPPQILKIAYITQTKKVPAALSNRDAFIQHKGLAGAQLAIADNNTTGQFSGQTFQLQQIIVPATGDVLAVFKQQVSMDTDFIIANLPIDTLKQLANAEWTQKKLIFDATTTDDQLRNSQCLDNVLHMLPSRAMRADALAQYMLKKKWQHWFLVAGLNNGDTLYTNAIRRAAKRFGMQIVAHKQWTHNYDARRTAQADIPVFTQGIAYDVLVVADESGLFGEYLDYRTWIPRPIIGTQGLVAVAWHKTHEQWGAVQIQNRFKTRVKRWMAEEDYGAYLAARSIGEAATRTQSNQIQVIKDYLLSVDFALQGYKGTPLSFRSWNGQLRQPVLLAAARSLVTVAPIDGFLHPKTTLDTLGYDQAESTCHKPLPNNQKNPLVANPQSPTKNQEKRPQQTEENPQNWQQWIQQLFHKITP